MSTKMKIKTAPDGGYDILVLAKHPMETGNRKDAATGQTIPAHYITTMEFSINGEAIAHAHLSPGISVNPLIGLRIANAASGDVIGVTWLDNQGETDSVEERVT